MSNEVEFNTRANCDRDCLECVEQFFGTLRYFQGIESVRQALLKDPNTLNSSVTRTRVQRTFEIVIRRDVGVSDEVAKDEARQFASQAKADRAYLREQLALHGDTLHSRWKKKSKDKRKAWILEAQPDMYHHKYPAQRTSYRMDGSIEGIADDPKEHRTKKSSGMSITDPMIENTGLLPYLNVETLMQDPGRLLSLLHYRTTSELEEWVMFDSAQLRLCFTSVWLPVRYNENCIVLHGERYGELVAWDKKDSHIWTTVGWPRGVLILKAQAVLFRFLRNIVDVIVSGTEPRGSLAWQSVTSSGFQASRPAEYWSLYTNAAFSAAPRFAPVELSRKVRALLASAEDHLWFLQTDPAYLQGTVVRQIRQEYLVGMAEDIKWALITDSILYAANDVRQLRGVLVECEHVSRISEACKPEIDSGSPFPQLLEHAIAALEILCINYYQFERIRHRQLLPGIPGFAKNYETLRLPDGNKVFQLKNLRGDYGTVDEWYFREDPLCWALQKLTFDPETVDQSDVSMRMGFIDDHLAEADSRERARINRTLYDQISRMCCYWEIVSAVRLHRPRPMALHVDDLNEGDRSRPGYAYWFEKGDARPSNPEHRRLRDLLEKIVECPMPKGRRDQDWLAKGENARTCLGAFWTCIREVRSKSLSRIGHSTDQIQEDPLMFAAETSKEHLAEIETERNAVEAFLAAENEKKTNEAAAAVAPQQRVWGDEKDVKKFELPADRIKPKTRPETIAPDDSAAEDDLAEAISETTLRPRIAVNAESLRIFARMFPASAGDFSKGLVKWQPWPMPAGFAATHSGGSAVHFNPVDDEGGSIVFHKPHPDPNVDPIMLQTMGKRMRKWFGWDRDSFVEREKPAN